MPDQKLSQLQSATTPLAGTEQVYVVQGGNSRKTTVSAVAPGTNLTYTPASRTLASSTGDDVVLPVATTTDAGLESAADKTKLDSITVDTATLVRKYVRNNSGVSIPKGAAVYQTGSSGTTLTVALADATDEATAAQTLGLAQETIGINSNGYIVAVGLVDGISTATLTEGQIVWLSETAGQLTTTRPTQPAHGVVCGYCVKQASGTAGILYVKVDNGLELDELHDVIISSPTTGQVLRRASDGLWKNASLTASDVSGLSTVATSGAYGDLSGRPTLGTAAPLDVAAAGDASASQVVKGNDSRLTDARTPTAHTQAASTISDSTTAGRALLTAADAPAQRTALGLGSLATQSGTFSGTSSGTNTGDVTLAASVADILNLSGQELQADDPGADRLLFWDDSEGKLAHLQLGTNLSITGTTLNAAGGGGASFNGYAVGNWITPVDGLLGVGGAAGTANTLYLIPCMVKRSITVSDLGGRVSTPVAASTVQLAIYASSNGLPTGLPLASTGDLSSATSTTISAAVTPFNMTAGELYWMGVSASSVGYAMVIPAGTSTSPASLIGAPNLNEIASTNSVFTFNRFFSATYGTWPDLTGQTTTVNTANRGAAVFLKISALL